jgi:hypothetical protein
MINAIREFFNWRKYPANVFFFVLPLAGLGLGCDFGMAYRAITIKHDFTFMWIFVAGAFLLISVVGKMYVNHLRIVRQWQNSK